MAVAAGAETLALSRPLRSRLCRAITAGRLRNSSLGGILDLIIRSMRLAQVIVSSSGSSHPMLIIATLLWLVIVGCGVGVLFEYAATPGAGGNPPARWPGGHLLAAPRDKPVLVMIAHPQCPCTRASLSELAKIMSGRQSKLKAYVLFFKPPGFAELWTQSDLWQIASSIPGVTAVADSGGEEAERFHVTTSGHTLLYDRNGRLAFSGGITGARGHAGDNQGTDLVLYSIDQGKESKRCTAVFGCPIRTASGQ